MTLVVHCECGYNAEGQTEDELVADVEEHVQDTHPEVAGKISREQILEMAHEH